MKKITFLAIFFAGVFSCLNAQDCNTITTFSWTYDFSEAWGIAPSDSDLTAPACWNNISNGSLASFHWQRLGNQGVGNTPCAQFNGNQYQTYNDWLITPAVQLTGNQQMTFYAKKYYTEYFPDFTPTLSIFVLTDQLDPSTATFVTQFVLTNGDYEEFTADLTSYSGTYYIAFVRADVGHAYCYLDDIKIEGAGSCPRPVQVAASNMGDTYGTITWNGGGVSPNGFKIAIGTSASFNPENLITFTTGNVHTYNLPTGTLAPATDYYIAVQTLCAGDEKSDWSAIAHCKTTTVPATLPYSCDFENATENALWTMEQADNAAHAWIIGSNINNGGTHCLYISNDGSNYVADVDDNNDYMDVMFYAFRDFAFPADRDAFELSFDWRCQSSTEVDYDDWMDLVTMPIDDMRVFIGTPVEISNFSFENGPAGATELNGSFYQKNTWNTFTTTLDGSYAGTVQRLWFVWDNGGPVTYNVNVGKPSAVDNVKLKVLCTDARNITVTNITATTAVINWQGGADSFTIEYGPQGFSLGTGISLTTTNNSDTLTGLDPATTYTIYVKSVCPGFDDAEWASKNFTTTACTDPTTIMFTAIDATEATIEWNGTSGLYNVEYGVYGFTQGTGTSFTTTNNSCVLTGLTPQTGYTVYVQGTCIENAPWVNTSFTTLEGNAINEQNDGQKITIMPNPATSVLNIETETNFDQIQILNLLGQNIYRNNLNTNNISINISDLQAGIYFIRLSFGNNIVTKKFIKK